MRLPRRPSWWLGALSILTLGLLLLVGPLAPSNPSPSGARMALNGASSTVATNVAFQGTSVAAHGTAASAIVTSFAGAFTTIFFWNATSGSALVTEGVLSITFLGATVGTSSQEISGAIPGTSGHITLTSDFSQNKYLFEGVYQLQATLLDNGQQLYTTSFYVWVQASDHITVVNIALFLIGGYEIYQIVALGSVRAARKQLGLEPTKKVGV